MAPVPPRVAAADAALSQPRGTGACAGVQHHAEANQLDQIMRAAAGDPSRKAEAARAEVQPRLRRCHLTRCPDREFQHLAKRT